MKEELIELFNKSNAKYWEKYPVDCLDDVKEESEESKFIDKLNDKLAEDIIALIKRIDKDVNGY